MAHEHHHHHHHHGEGSMDKSLKNTYIWAIALNVGFVVIETIIGIIYNSLGLVSDAGHNLSDVVSLVLALVAFGLMASHSRKGFTYGFRKSSVLISLTNAVLLLVAVGVIVVESIHKFSNPSPINGEAISWTAGIGIIINGFTAYLLMRKQGHDINTKGAYLHMLADTLVSVGVVISGIIISFTGWYVIDPIISLLIAAIILISTWDLLKESVRLSIDAVPESIDAESIEKAMAEAEGVEGVHHVHIWAISTTETALTAHLVISDITRAEHIVHAVKDVLRAKGIAHSTLEVETEGSGCTGESCC